MSTPTNHLPAELAPITKSLDMIERDIPDSPLEPMPPNGNPKREIPAEILGLEERYIKNTPKQEPNSGSGVNAIEHSADVKKQEEDSVSVILPPTPSIPSSISKIEAQVNEHAGYVKKKKKGSFLVLPPPETLKSQEFEYNTPPGGGKGGGGGGDEGGGIVLGSVAAPASNQEFDYWPGGGGGGGEGGGGGGGGGNGGGRIILGSVAAPASNPEPKQVDEVVPKAVPPDSSDDNGVHLTVSQGDTSKTTKEGKLLDFIIVVVVLICFCIGLRD
jgi:hypothetical protein